MLATVRSDFAPLVEDRPLDTTLRTVLARMRSGAYKPASPETAASRPISSKEKK